MIHKDKEEFQKIISRVASQTGFVKQLIEKDYYLTIILSEVSNLSEHLIFKGGTSLNKIYYPNYRMSEDLDFNLLFRAEQTKEEKRLNQSDRRTKLTDIAKKINGFMQQFDLISTEALKTHDNSRQYNFVFGYNSIITNKTETIKLEIRSKANGIILPATDSEIKHNFIHPFTKKPLFNTGTVRVLSLKEILADKLAAAINRSKPRDFFDIDYAIKNKFDFTDKEFIKIFQNKLENDKNSTELLKYQDNLGLKDNTIKDLPMLTQNDLIDVLLPAEMKSFNIANVIERINTMMGRMIAAEKEHNITTEIDNAPGLGN